MNVKPSTSTLPTAPAFSSPELTRLKATAGFAQLTPHQQERLTTLLATSKVNGTAAYGAAVLNRLVEHRTFATLSPPIQAKVLELMFKTEWLPSTSLAVTDLDKFASATLGDKTELASYEFRGATQAAIRQELKVGTDTIELVSPKEYDPHVYSYHPEDVAKALEFMDPKLRAGVKRIVINPVMNPDDARYTKEGFNRNKPMDRLRELEADIKPLLQGRPIGAIEQMLLGAFDLDLTASSGGFHSGATALDGELHVYPADWPGDVMKTLAPMLSHEAGHSLTDRFGHDESSPQWKALLAARQADSFGVTKYGEASPFELGAEFAATYYDSRETPAEAKAFDQLYPNASKIFETIDRAAAKS